MWNRSSGSFATASAVSLTNGDGGDFYNHETKLEEVAWTFAMLLIIGSGTVGNLFTCYSVFRREHLRKPCFYILCNTAIADCVRAAVCFPAVVVAMWTGRWTYDKFMCDMLAFLNIYLYYGVLYTTLLLSVERYLAVRFHRFHRQRLTGPACLLVLLFTWLLAIATASPSILNPEAYGYARAEFQCTFKRTGFYGGVLETGYCTLFFFADNFLTALFYVRTFVFMKTRRKLRPIQFVPATSSSWTFYGPGSTGQAASNWSLGYRQNAGASAPPTVAPVQPSNHAHLALIHPNIHKEVRLSKIFLFIAIVNVLLWTPYMIHCVGLSFHLMELPDIYVTNFTWLTYLQTCTSPLICFFTEIRKFS